MRLIFLIQKNAWFVEFEQDWYRLIDQRDIELAAAGLVLKVVDQFQLVEQPHHAGSATVKQKGKERLLITLTGPDGAVIVKVPHKLDQQSLISIDWTTHPYRDGWVSANAELTVERCADLSLTAYLPGDSHSDGKTLTILNTADGSETEIWLARDRQTKVPMLSRAGNRKTTLRLSCPPESITQSSDARQLGFILMSQKARAA